MTKTAALHSFFNSFGITAYPITSVPDRIEFPYMTYEPVTSSWLDGEVNCTVNLWYYTDTESVPNAKADEISRAIGLGGIRIPCEDGFIWVKKGSPFCQSLREETEDAIKRRYINITLEFMTSF